MKTLILSDTDKRILFIDAIQAGSVHDYAQMKQTFDPTLPWFNQAHLWLDLGFHGVTRDYGSKGTFHIPHKKPRKSKANPQPELTTKQKQENKRQAASRIVVEHAIGGMKHFHCLMHRIRNHLDSFIDSFFCLSGGLWNLKLTL